ncbi:MAG: ribose-phosphate pyrophosphokinase [Lachnospiraceae bacterium]|nr:ribose-phosphate pyrophosphokinase [Lachnospiraceae bacterium]
MPNLKELEHALPVAPLKLVVMESAEKLGNEINAYLVQFRKTLKNTFRNDPALQGYSEESFLARAYCPRFGTGEAKGMFLDSVRGKDLFILTDICNHSITYTINGRVNHKSPDDHYQDLKRVIAAATNRTHRINVIMPFLYEGRQHKRTARESLDCAMMLEELYHMGIHNFITFDAHDPKICNSIPLNGFDNYVTPYNFVQALLDKEKDLIIDKDHLVVISPDEGALNRAIFFANVLGVNTGMFYKRRDYTTIVNGRNPIVAHEFLGDSLDGKDVIIMDDMISSGESMLDTARLLKEMNARRVFICCTFGLFTNGIQAFDKAYEKCYFERLITTNLNYHPPELESRPYYLQANMSKFIASIINFMNHDVSMENVHTSADKIRRRLDSYNRREDIEHYN